MAKPPAALRVSLDQARAAFLAAQGFPPPAKSSLLQTLERTGFVRTLGGVDVYLALRARVPGMTRADLDGAVARHDAQVVPSVRGCIYLVPRRDVAASLRVADLLSRSRAEREHQKAGIKPGEVEKVGKEAFSILRKKGPLTTDSLRRALPEGVVRSLGEKGKTVGISSPLPLALRLLEFEGKIERTLEEGRLDTERYLWRSTEKNPFGSARLPKDPAELWPRFAEVFFQAAALGTARDFAAWAGIPQRDAKDAMERLSLITVQIEGVEEQHFLLEEFRKPFLDADGARDAVCFLPFDDNLMTLRGGPALLVDSAHHGLSVPVWGSSKKTTLGEARYMSFRSIVAEGKIVGFWEYDPDAKSIVSACFDKVAASTRKRIDATSVDISRFLAEDIGHGKSFSIDTDEELRRRAQVIRKLGR